MGLYIISRNKGDYNKALEYIENCIKATTPGDTRWVNGMAQKAESQILNSYKTSDNNYYKEAIKTYESLLEKMPTNTYILNNTAYLIADNDQDLDKALGFAKRACELKPEDPGYIDTYAYVLYKKGQYAEALRFSRASLQQYEVQRIPPPAAAYEHLGQSLEKSGEISQARAAYEQALESGGENLDKPTKDRLTATVERIRNLK
jgi:tetratricopeptide (TPR) repeat protein